MTQLRSRTNQNVDVALIKLDGVQTKADTDFYLGKRLAYLYKGKKEINGTRRRVIWGKVVRPHGSSGVVQAKFRKNLPPSSFGKKVRVMLYPSRI